MFSAELCKQIITLHSSFYSDL